MHNLSAAFVTNNLTKIVLAYSTVDVLNSLGNLLHYNHQCCSTL